MKTDKKQNAVNQAALKARRKKAGLLRVEYWLTVEQKAAVDNMLKGDK